MPPDTSINSLNSSTNTGYFSWREELPLIFRVKWVQALVYPAEVLFRLSKIFPVKKPKLRNSHPFCFVLFCFYLTELSWLLSLPQVLCILSLYLHLQDFFKEKNTQHSSKLVSYCKTGRSRFPKKTHPCLLPYAKQGASGAQWALLVPHTGLVLRGGPGWDFLESCCTMSLKISQVMIKVTTPS